MSAFHNNTLIGSSGQQGYTISRSVRLRSSVSAYFNRTFTTPTLGTKWTWSAWVKRGTLGAAQTLFSGQVDVNNWGYIQFLAGDTLSFAQADAASVTSTVTTTQVFRDSSAWYHIVVVFDSTQATAANRLIMYVNGVQITSYGTATYLAQNTVSRINAAVAHQLGRYISAANYVDGYMTEVNFIDGQALTPSSFGETNAVTGVWKAKKYAGTYGTNGFYLNFSDNSAATAAAIGKDYSGNGNNWTPNNISVTAGTTYDSMLDTPTPYADGGNGRGNYAVLNLLFTSGKAQETITYSQGNLVITSGATAGYWIGTGSTLGFSMSGSFYAELLLTTGVSQGQAFGVVDVTNNAVLSARSGASPYSGICINHTGAVFKNGVNVANVAATTSGDIISIAFDGPNSQVIFKKNNATWYTVTSIPSVDQYVFFGYISDGCSQTWNFGQRPFTYTPPTGFNALNTFNLPDSTIKNGANYMAATLYTGNGSTQSITNTVNGVSFQPDFVWIKVRSASATDHYLADAVRGATKFLQSDTTAAEGTNNGLTAFNSNGFSVGAIGDTNTNTATLVGWQWNAGGTSTNITVGQYGTSPNVPSIASTVRANATAGFSIVTYTGTGANATVGHGLGVAPKMVIVKQRTGTAQQWAIWHTALLGTEYLGFDTAAKNALANVWNSTIPTSSVFSIGANGSSGANTINYVAYCFAAVAGYSAFGSYTGNGSADGPFVYCGFRPRYVMLKSTTAARDWLVYDTARGTYNVLSEGPLQPNTAGTPYGAGYLGFDILSNGFKLRETTTNMNASGETHIYAAFAENPFKNSLAR